MRQEDLRDKFSKERYEYSIASDLRNFGGMLNEKDPNLNWRLDWFIAYEKGRYTPNARLSPLPAQSKSEFDRIYKELNKDSVDNRVRVAECSKYAGHAMSILLSDKKITDEYNVCLAGLGTEQNHNVAMLIPKEMSTSKKGSYTEESLPKGTLIVDPWAMAMGHSAGVSLAVEPKNYAYSDMLEKITLSYQSVNDPMINPTKSRHRSADDLIGSEGPVSPKTPDSLISSSSGSLSPRTPVTPSSASLSPPPIVDKPSVAARPVIASRPIRSTVVSPFAREAPVLSSAQKPVSPGKLTPDKLAKLDRRLFGTPTASTVVSTPVSASSRLKGELTDLRNSVAPDNHSKKDDVSPPKSGR